MMDERLRDLIERANYVHVATLMPDGSPSSVAMWGGMEGDFVTIFTGGSKTQKAKNLARDGRVAISIVDFEAILIDGEMPAMVRERLTARTIQAFDGLDRRGLSDVVIASGTVGADAGAIGGAALPLVKAFGRDREVLLKDVVAQAS